MRIIFQETLVRNNPSQSSRREISPTFIRTEFRRTIRTESKRGEITIFKFIFHTGKSRNQRVRRITWTYRVFRCRTPQIRQYLIIRKIRAWCRQSVWLVLFNGESQQTDQIMISKRVKIIQRVIPHISIRLIFGNRWRTCPVIIIFTVVGQILINTILQCPVRP